MNKLTGPEYVATQHQDPNTPPTQPPNIIVIVADTYRYDNLFDRAAMPVRDAQPRRLFRACRRACRNSTPAASPPSRSAPT